MAIFEEDTPLGERRRFAKFAHIPDVIRRALTLKWPRRPAKPLHISDHLARDIGLSAADLEALRHEWPSQTTHHPRG